MCGLDPLSIAGMTLGAASGAATAVGESQAASVNSSLIKQEASREYAILERQRLAEHDVALKEGYQSVLETDRGISAVRAKGEGMGGTTAALQVAEQKRQGALSIANAKDRQQAANATYAMSAKHTQLGAQGRIDAQTPNPFTQITNIATSGLQNYGAFR